MSRLEAHAEALIERYQIKARPGDRVALETIILARNEGRDYLREGPQILEQAIDLLGGEDRAAPVDKAQQPRRREAEDEDVEPGQPERRRHAMERPAVAHATLESKWRWGFGTGRCPVQGDGHGAPR